jgi:hypothetical protein
MKCLFGHEWSDWEKHYMNDRVWVHVKTMYRHCNKCGESERKIVDIDCTQFRRGRGWCGTCESTIKNHPQLAKIPYFSYTYVMKPKGRLPKIEDVKLVKLFRSLKEPLTMREIVQFYHKRGRKEVNLKTVWNWANYDDQRLEEAEIRLSRKNA